MSFSKSNLEEIKNSLDQKTKVLYRFLNKKFFLKNIFKNTIPKNVLSRKKHGFAFPTDIILRDVNLIEELIDYDVLINKKFFKNKYKNYIDKKEDCSLYIWNELILNLALQNLKKNHRDLHLFTCSIDKGLDKNKFILPGLGDAGDRYMGT